MPFFRGLCWSKSSAGACPLTSASRYNLTLANTITPSTNNYSNKNYEPSSFMVNYIHQ